MVAQNQTGQPEKSATTNSALLLIEFQKTWTDKGIFHFLIKSQYQSRGVLQNTKDVLSVARPKGWPVMQAPLILDKDDPARYKKTPLPARLFKRFEKGTWKAELTDGIYDASDIVIKGRSSYDATIDSDLLDRLHDNNIQTVYVCGFTTDHCVKDTMNTLMAKGYDCVMVTDCTATRSGSLQSKIEQSFKTIDSQALIDLIKHDEEA